MWYYEQNGNRIGPVEEATMRGLIADRTISIDTLVWTNGMANWTPLQQTQLAAGLPLPPPMPQVATAAPVNVAPVQTSEAPPRPKKKPPLWQVLLAVFVGIPSAIVLSIAVPCVGLFIAIFVGIKIFKAIWKD